MVRLKNVLLIALCVFGASSEVAFGQAPTWGKGREINQLTEHVYRFGVGPPLAPFSQNGMFVVTPAGIIVADGRCDHMEWLKSELKARFNLPVKYVVLSHAHHVCDTQVFADTAIGVGHVNVLPHIIREKQRAIVPQVLFEERMEIVLGGMRVVLFYLGPTHSDDHIFMHVPDEGVLFAADLARGYNIVPDFRDLEVHNTLKALRTLAYMPEVTIVLDGHAQSATTQEAFLIFREYLAAIRDRVLERMVAGKTLTEIRKEVTMEDFLARGYNQNPGGPPGRQVRDVTIHVDTMYDYLWRYRDSQVPRAPRD